MINYSYIDVSLLKKFKKNKKKNKKKKYRSTFYSKNGVSNTGVNFTPKMEWFCTFFFYSLFGVKSTP